MKRLQKPILALLLCSAMAVAGCSTAWLTTVGDLIAAAAPALINILNIVAIAKGQPINGTLENQIESDATKVQTLAGDFAKASSVAAPGVCSQLQAAIGVYSADEQQVISIAQVSDPNTQSKVEALSALVAGTVPEVLGLIPNCAHSLSLMAVVGGKQVPLPLKSFVKAYNAVLVAPTNNSKVDAYTKGHKLKVHSTLLSVVTLGHSY